MNRVSYYGGKVRILTGQAGEMVISIRNAKTGEESRFPRVGPDTTFTLDEATLPGLLSRPTFWRRARARFGRRSGEAA